MNTPICDFVKNYIKSDVQRFHMPGHKGRNILGFEGADLTEVDGADSLYLASGIIAQSEQNAGKLFGAQTFYSTEGASLAIKAMLHLASRYARAQGKSPVIVAGRNAHKAFVSASALVGFDVEWIFSADQSYLSCAVTAEQLGCFLDNLQSNPVAVYLTSPDYLGNTVELKSIAKVCKERGVLLLVDNAHGAYLKFLSPSLHPIDIGADMCCDSAHKTLPCLTGGAYLHVSNGAPKEFCENAKSALALFGSTSPSYLILQSLDALNAYIANGYANILAEYTQKVSQLKCKLLAHGWTVCGNEPLKVTLATKAFGYTGDEVAKILSQNGIVCEFHDPDHIVFMLTPDNGDLTLLEDALTSIPKKKKLADTSPKMVQPHKVLSVRDATLAPCKTVSINNAVGEILADLSIGCPPAVPIVVCGEQIDELAIQCFRYYGIKKVCVVDQAPNTSCK